MSTKTKLLISHGVGLPYEVDGETASKYEGTTIEVLGRIVEEHVHDSGLLATLRDSRVALDQFSEGAEKPLPPQSNWSEVAAQLEETDVEVGVAKSHEGGWR